MNISMIASWGSDGHKIVAQIAQNYLTEKAYATMTPYLNGFSLPDMATWPDSFDHGAGPWSENLHFVNFPTNATKFYLAYCEPQYTEVGCVVTAIQNYSYIVMKELENNEVVKCEDASSGSIEPCTISNIVHFIGDVHQPLHSSYAIDEGGNYVDVEFNNECTNLHTLWDSTLIYYYEDENDYDWEQVAKILTSEIQRYPLNAGNWSLDVDPSNWANESFQRTRTEVYNFQPGSVSPRSDFSLSKRSTSSSSSCGYSLSLSYYDRSIPYIFDQLMKAGVRLATRLNSIFDASFKPPLSIVPYQY